MSPALLRRQAALAGVALLAAIAALALARLDDPSATEAVIPGDQPWLEASASVWTPGSNGEASECGVELTPETRGITHPVLPCGVELLLSFEGRTVQAEVVDRGPHAGSAEFELTEVLARELGFSGTQPIRWRFAD